MRKPHPKEIESVLSLSARDRYRYFVKCVAELEEVWSLYDQGYVSVGDDRGSMHFPLWPRQEFAEMVISGLYASAVPKPIEWKFWVDSMVPNICLENEVVAVFPKPDVSEFMAVPIRQIVEDVEGYALEVFGEERTQLSQEDLERWPDS